MSRPIRKIPIEQLSRISGCSEAMIRANLGSDRARFDADKHVLIDCPAAIAWVHRKARYKTGQNKQRVRRVHVVLSQPTMAMLKAAYPKKHKKPVIIKALSIASRLAAYTDLLAYVRPTKVKKRYHKWMEGVDRWDWIRVRVLAYCCRVSASDVTDFAIRFYLSNVENFTGDEDG